MNSNYYKINDIEVYSFIFDVIDSVMYIVIFNNNVFVIDPHQYDSVLKFIQNKSCINIILTHEHFDHISGVNWFRDNFENVQVYASETCARKIVKLKNGTELFPLLLIGNKKAYNEIKKKYKFPYYCNVDKIFSNSMIIKKASHCVELLETPGHTDCAISVLIDKCIIFAGDNLLGNGQEFRSIDSNINEYRNITLPIYKSLLKNNIVVFPGHGKPNNIEYFLNRQEL